MIFEDYGKEIIEEKDINKRFRLMRQIDDKISTRMYQDVFQFQMGSCRK